MISEYDIIKIGKIFGLDKNKLAKKLFLYYMKRGIRNYHGLVPKEIQCSLMYVNFDDPLYARVMFIDGIHSYSVTSCFYNEIKSGMKVFDIGANIGYLTLLAARMSGNDGLVVAFEPSIESCEILQKSLLLNKYKNVEIINKAIADKSKKGKLFISPYGSVINKIVDEDDESTSADIEIITLDDFVNMKKIIPDFIKIDVQGAEYLVLEGMKNLLEKKIPLKLVIEFSSRTQQDKLNNFINYWNKLIKLGFKPFYLKEPRKPIDVKSNTIYKNEIKKEIKNIDNLGFSNSNEVDVLFVRE